MMIQYQIPLSSLIFHNINHLNYPQHPPCPPFEIMFRIFELRFTAIIIERKLYIKEMLLRTGNDNSFKFKNNPNLKIGMRIMRKSGKL